MYKRKRLLLLVIVTIYILLTGFEFIKYFMIDSNLFGAIYLIINLVILFFLLPILYNYKRNYSKIRISKLIIVIIIGIFNSYILENIIISSMSYIDSSQLYIESIYIVKNILKGFTYGLLVLFTLFESKLNEKITLHIDKIEKKH